MLGARTTAERPCGLIGLKMRATSLTEGGVTALLEPLASQVWKKRLVHPDLAN